ncbi:MAG: chemotaxis protein CheX [Bryobacterales bacterium]|jgi:chemotaxis protein CheX|nr:chemotaxis protein CheX [Bryobacterales bacterium]
MEAKLSLTEHLDEIRGMVEMIFMTMLDMTARPVSQEWQKCERSVTASIYFAGPWKGAAMIECSRDAALEFTRLLAGPGDADDFNDSVRDVLGELANTIGGNLKAILPKGTTLSMPVVVQGSDYLIWFSGGNTVSRIAFECDAGIVWLHVIEVQPKMAPEAVVVLA